MNRDDQNTAALVADLLERQGSDLARRRFAAFLRESAETLPDSAALHERTAAWEAPDEDPSSAAPPPAGP